MKKLLLLGAILSPVAFAADNTITFKGEVTEATCQIAVNGEAASPVVLLPTVSTSELSAAGSTAGQTPFEITLSECPISGNARTASAVFVGNNVTSGGNLGNTGTASNVDIQILDTSDAVIDFTSGFNGAGDLTVTPGSRQATATYTAQYFATSESTAGTVQATLQYAVSYQ